MNLVELTSIAVALSMDALAVSVACGFSARSVPNRNAIIAALFFGGFQAGMPALGWSLGELAYSQIEAYDHWVAFFLLLSVGIKMIWDSFSGGECDCKKSFINPLNYAVLFALAVATSLDAFAVGISFSCRRLPIVFPALYIGATTFIISLAGLKFSSKIGDKFGAKMNLLGGLVLIAIAVKVVVEG